MGIYMNYGAVILAGGKSSRMGSPKSRLQLNGVRFLDKLVYELSSFDELFISVEDAQNHSEIIYPMVSDIIPDCGPMGGLYEALKTCTSDALLAVPCDVPLFSHAMARQLCAEMDEQTDAVIAVTQDGRMHPLCGVYKKSCIAVLEQCIQQKNYRMGHALAKLRIKQYQTGRDSWRLCNVNTPQEFQALTDCEPPDCIAVCGWKDSGKTTLIEKLIPILVQRGLRIAVIKHDGHSYVPDVPGTDSYRFLQAGAESSVIYDRNKYSLTRYLSITETEVLELAQGADLILLEGFKQSDYPKIEIIRSAVRQTPLPDLKGKLAYVSDIETMIKEKELPVFRPDDLQGIAAFMIAAYESGKLKERWPERNI